MKDWKEKAINRETAHTIRELSYGDILKQARNDEKSAKAMQAFKHVPKY